MVKDKANIFKFDKNTLKEYTKDPFFDCIPGAKEYAECIKSTILNKETPYVLMLNENFGMGKSYFVTRFTQHLRNNNVDCIYFSAWENDYLELPFVSFSKEIIKYFQNKSMTKKASTEFVKATKSIYKVISSIAKATSFSANANLGVFSTKVSLDSNKAITAAEDFIQSFIKKDDYLIAFKKTLKGFIDSLKNKKLVIIVDELDRCRPDYAMKTLEIIKHFFDIEGLFIIVPTNENSLFKCVKSLYGFNEETSTNTESYFKKFFDDIETLYKPNYLEMVKNIINEKSLEECIKQNYISLDCDQYYSLNLLQVKISKYGETEKFTIREMDSMCKRILYYCKCIQQKIDCEYLTCLLFNKYSRQKVKQCFLSPEHRFANNGKKQQLLQFLIPDTVFNGFDDNYAIFQRYYPTFRATTFQTYKEFDDFYKKAVEEIENGLKPTACGSWIQDFSIYKENVSAYINSHKEEIDEYRIYWDSDDNDHLIKNFYHTIVENDYKLFEIKS